MYTHLDASLTMPRPRDATRAVPPRHDALPDELLCDTPRPAAKPASWTGALAAVCGGLLLILLSGLLLAYAGLTG